MEEQPPTIEPKQTKGQRRTLPSTGGLTRLSLRFDSLRKLVFSSVKSVAVAALVLAAPVSLDRVEAAISDITWTNTEGTENYSYTLEADTSGTYGSTCYRGVLFIPNVASSSLSDGTEEDFDVSSGTETLSTQLPSGTDSVKNATQVNTRGCGFADTIGQDELGVDVFKYGLWHYGSYYEPSNPQGQKNCPVGVTNSKCFRIGFVPKDAIKNLKPIEKVVSSLTLNITEYTSPVNTLHSFTFSFTITGDSDQTQTVSFEKSEITVNESDSAQDRTVAVKAVLSKNISANLTAGFTIESESTVTTGEDFIQPNQLAFTFVNTEDDNELEATVNFGITDDMIDDPDEETIVLKLSDGGTDYEESTDTLTIKIVDDEEPSDVSFQANSRMKSITESAGYVDLDVELSAAYVADARVKYVLEDSTTLGSATLNTDFQDAAGAMGEITVTQGGTTGKIRINITPDILVESDETFTVTIVDSITATAADSNIVATVTILDDDSPVANPTSCASPPSAPAGNFTVTLTGTPGTYHVAGSSLNMAISPDNYTAVTNDANIVATDYFGNTIETLAEGFVETTDQTATFSSLPGSSNSGYRGFYRGIIEAPPQNSEFYRISQPCHFDTWITDADRPGIEIAIAQSHVPNNRMVTLTVTATPPPTNSLDVPIVFEKDANVSVSGLTGSKVTIPAGSPSVTATLTILDTGTVADTQVTVAADRTKANYERNAAYWLADGLDSDTVTYLPQASSTIPTVNFTSDSIRQSVEENSGSVSFRVRISNLYNGGDVTIPYNIVAGTATAGNDYINPNTRQVVFTNADGNQKEFSVQVLTDLMAEDAETFSVVIDQTSLTNAVAGSNLTAAVTIRQNSGLSGLTNNSFQASASDTYGNTCFSGIVRVPGNSPTSLNTSSAALEILNSNVPNFTGSMSNGTSASTSSDPCGFSSASATGLRIGSENELSYGSWYVGAAICPTGGKSDDDCYNVGFVPSNDVKNLSPVEQVVSSLALKITESANTVFEHDFAASVTIVGDPDQSQTVRFEHSEITVNESDAAAGSNFTVSVRAILGKNITSNLTAGFTIEGGTATAGVDFMQPAALTFTFNNTDNDNELAASVNFVVVNDSNDEPQIETIILRLADGGSDYSLAAPYSLTIKIIDDDETPLPTVNFAAESIAPTVDEIDGSVTLKLTISHKLPADNVTIPYAIVAGTATAGKDYIVPSDRQVIFVGDDDGTEKDFSIQILSDFVSESAESFSVVISGSNLTNAVPGTNLTATVTISQNSGLNGLTNNMLEASASSEYGNVCYKGIVRVATTNNLAPSEESSATETWSSRLPSAMNIVQTGSGTRSSSNNPCGLDVIGANSLTYGTWYIGNYFNPLNSTQRCPSGGNTSDRCYYAGFIPNNNIKNLNPVEQVVSVLTYKINEFDRDSNVAKTHTFTASVTITGDSTHPLSIRFAESEITVNEGDNDLTVSVKALLNKNISSNLTAGFTIGATGTATAGDDFIQPETLAFEFTNTSDDNELEATVDFTIVNDTDREALEETIILTLQDGGSNYGLASPSALTIKILDNEAASTTPSVSYAAESISQTVDEIDGSVTFKLELSNDFRGSNIRVPYIIVPGTATAGTDFLIPSTQEVEFVTFVDTMEKDFSIRLVTDLIGEQEESFRVDIDSTNLTNAVAGTNLTATVTIKAHTGLSGLTNNVLEANKTGEYGNACYTGLVRIPPVSSPSVSDTSSGTETWSTGLPDVDEIARNATSRNYSAGPCPFAGVRVGRQNEFAYGNWYMWAARCPAGGNTGDHCFGVGFAPFDSIKELRPVEQVVSNLSMKVAESGNSGIVHDFSASVTITGDPNQPQTVRFEQSEITIDESASNAERNLSIKTLLSKNITTDLTAGFTVGGTATSGLDFMQPNTIEFVFSNTADNSELEATVNIQIEDDSDIDATRETIVLTLQDGGSNYSLESPSTLTVTIVDNDVPTLSISAGVDAIESENQFAEFEITTPIMPKAPLSIIYTPVSDNYLLPGESGVLVNDAPHLTFKDSDGDGIYTAILNVRIPDDSDVEPIGDITVTLADDDSTPPTYLVAGGSNRYATVKVFDDDGPPVVRIYPEANSVVEGQNAVFNLRMVPEQNTPFPISLRWSQQGNYIFAALTRTVTIQPRFIYRLEVPTVDDYFDEIDGSVSLGAVATANNSAVSDVSIAITDNDVLADSSRTRYSVAASVIRSILLSIPHHSSPVNHEIESLVTITAVSQSIQEGEAAEFVIAVDQTVDQSTTVRIGLDQRGDFIRGPMQRSVNIAEGMSEAKLAVETENDELAEEDGEITATIQEGSGYQIGSQNSANVTVSDVIDRLRRKNQVGTAMQSALPELLANSTTRSLRITKDRVNQALHGNTATSIKLKGHSTVRSMLQTGGEMLNTVETNWQSLIDGSSFAIALHPGGEATSPATVWGLGEQQSLKSNSTSEMPYWEGESLTGHFGFDATVGQGMLAGLAMSVSQSQVGFGPDGSSGMSFDTHTTGIHPYFGFTSPQVNTQLQITTGYGVNEIELKQETYAPEILHGSYHTLGLAGSNRIFSNSFEDGHSFNSNIAGQAWHSQQSVNEVPGVVDSLHVNVRHAKISIESTYAHKLSTDKTLTPSISIGLRGDARNEKSIFGLNVGGGIRYDAFDAIEVLGSGKSLLSELNRMHRWEIESSLEYDSGSDGKGVLFSVSQSWNGTDANVERYIWGSEPLNFSDESFVSGDGGSISAEIGYGFAILGDSAVLTPYSAFHRAKTHGNEFRVGSHFATNKGLNFELEIVRDIPEAGTRGHEFNLTGNIRW